jgi:hypothetical protein
MLFSNIFAVRSLKLLVELLLFFFLKSLMRELLKI